MIFNSYRFYKKVEVLKTNKETFFVCLYDH
jgi:hypothetical protein